MPYSLGTSRDRVAKINCSNMAYECIYECSFKLVGQLNATIIYKKPFLLIPHV